MGTVQCVLDAAHYEYNILVNAQVCDKARDSNYNCTGVYVYITGLCPFCLGDFLALFIHVLRRGHTHIHARTHAHTHTHTHTVFREVISINQAHALFKIYK